jgi:predicted SnoaL-like aldol condensation-catalyzing enzyme
MKPEEHNKALVEELIVTVITRHDFSPLDRIMRDDYIQHNPDCPQGKAGFKEFFSVIFKAIPDFRYHIIRLNAEGDFVMAYCNTLGSHTGGPWLGAPANGNRLDFMVVDIFRLQDGKIAEHWDVADTLTMFSQLGIAKRL